jgi:DNA (cytosine-5)-methyltransferase 1
MRYVVEDDDPYIVDGKGATLIQTGYGERPGQTPRVPGLHKPLGTIMAGGCKHALVTAHITKYYGTSTGSAADEPLHTVTGKAGGGHHGLCVSYLARHWGGMTGTRVDKPFPTITTKGCQDQVVEAHLQPAKEFSHTGEVRSFLMKYYGTATGQEVTKPAPTITTKDRLALVTVAGVDYEIVDIGMRMLTPRELYNAQGFPSDYQIDMTMPKSVGAMESKPKRMTKTTQIRLCGNSVSPPVAHAIIRENLPNILDEE